MSLFDAAQIVSILTVVSTAIGLFQKEKFKIMLCFTVTNVSMLATYALLGRWLSTILVALATIRTIVYYIYAVKNLKPNMYVFVGFEVLFIVVTMLLWKDYFDLLMLANLSLLAYTTWQDDMKVLRAGYLVSAILLIVYNILVKAYVGVISEAVLLVSSIISVIKFDIKNKVKDIVLCFYQTISSTYKTTIKEKEDYAFITSKSIKDEFNNFAYIKKCDFANFENFKKPICKKFKEKNQESVFYFLSKQGENIQEIAEIARQNQRLFNDTWMKLRSGYNPRRKICQLNIECKPVNEEWGEDLLYVFTKGFIHQSGDAIYKYDEEYATIYQQVLKEKKLKQHHITPYAAFLDGKMISVLFAYHNGTNIFLCQITTLEEYRRKGVASKLISYAVDIERKNGAGEFYLVTESYTYLENFYMKNNFQEIAKGVCVKLLEK